ncbi:MAG TPA: nuclease-related domain-containing protein [Acidimicrobiales bacterium]|nr:nuclease-related domain-containing protein [Acidimicrobiales bacterium]
MGAPSPRRSHSHAEAPRAGRIVAAFSACTPTSGPGGSAPKAKKQSGRVSSASASTAGTSFTPIPVGRNGADIDHLLIGPGGFYTINTKNRRGKRVWVGERAVLVDGQRTAYLRSSRSEAERASKLLSAALGRPVPVRAVLVILTGSLVPNVTVKQQPADVLVLDRMDLPGVFRRAPLRMAAEEVEEVFALARRPETWR